MYFQSYVIGFISVLKIELKTFLPLYLVFNIYQSHDFLDIEL